MDKDMLWGSVWTKDMLVMAQLWKRYVKDGPWTSKITRVKIEACKKIKDFNK